MPFDALALIDGLEQRADELTEDEKNASLTSVYASLRPLFAVTCYAKEDVKTALMNSDISEVTGFEENEVLFEHGGNIYYFSFNAPQTDGLDGESLVAYNELYSDIETVKSTVMLIKQ